jgi:hypothetical protein
LARQCDAVMMPSAIATAFLLRLIAFLAEAAVLHQQPLRALD